VSFATITLCVASQRVFVVVVVVISLSIQSGNFWIHPRTFFPYAEIRTLRPTQIKKQNWSSFYYNVHIFGRQMGERNVMTMEHKNCNVLLTPHYRCTIKDGFPTLNHWV
jgi:hypothetical protein